MSTETKAMELRLAEIGRRIDSLMRKTGDVDVRESLRVDVDLWRRIGDELHLHGKLAAMEARDALTPTLERVEAAVARAHEVVDELIAGTDFDADEIESRVAAEMSGLRNELEAAGAEFRIA